MQCSLQPFCLETSRAADAPHFSVCWDDSINLQQVYTIVTWCYNIDWLLGHSNISSLTMLELGNSRRQLLNQSRPTHQFVEHQYHQTVVLSKRRKRGMVVPECTRQQTNTLAESLALRDIYKWQYRAFTGENWSPRNRGAKRGFQQFIKLWEQLYEKIKAATEVGGAQLWCPSDGDVALLVDDLNELLMLTRTGRRRQGRSHTFLPQGI